MTDDQRHDDATRPEPPDGQSREQWMRPMFTEDEIAAYNRVESYVHQMFEEMAQNPLERRVAALEACIARIEAAVGYMLGR